MPVAQQGVSGGLKSARDLHEPLLPLPGLPLSQAKEMDCATSPGLTSDKDLRHAFGKVTDKDRDEPMPIPFQWLFSAWPKTSPKIRIFHSWGMGILLGTYLTAREQLLGYFLWCQGHWFGDGAKLMPEAFCMCKGCSREVLNGRANYTPVVVGRVNPQKQRSKAAK